MIYFLVFGCSFCTTSFAATDIEEFKRLESVLSTSGEFEFAVNNSYEKSYAKTRCVELFSRKGARKLGLICLSRDKDFAKDAGILDAQSVADHAGPSDGFDGYVVITPVSAISMRKNYSGQTAIYSATTDCDYGGNSIYRPTATCHIAYIPRQYGSHVYVNLLMVDHTSNKKVMTDKKIEKLWSILRGFD